MRFTLFIGAPNTRPMPCWSRTCTTCQRDVPCPTARPRLSRDRPINGDPTRVQDGAKRYDVLVDGVFLEIGLRPNSHAVSNVLQLTDRLEVPVNPDQSTAVSGLCAVDVTDVREKQIAIAVGQGAIVTLSAHKYLVEHQLT